MTVRVIEYYADVEGQDVPEMFCLVTDLMDITEYPGPELAGLYKWRWDGSETALREAKASLDGAGPGTGPMLRSGSPDLVRQELAAWAAAVEMTRGVARDAALAAAPARKGRRAGQPVRPREISHARTRRAVIAAIRTGRTCYETLTSEIGKYRTVIDRNRHRARKSKSPSSFGHASAEGHRHPHRRSHHHHGQQPSLTSRNTYTQTRSDTRRPVEPAVTRHDTPALSMPATRNYPPSPNRETRTDAQIPKAHGIVVAGPHVAGNRVNSGTRRTFGVGNSVTLAGRIDQRRRH